MHGRSRKTTRASDSQKPASSTMASDAAVSRAAITCSHSSSNESLESGRERRRRGKQKMQSRILELERRIQTLTAIINQIATPDDLGKTSTTEIFDLFADGTSYADAMVQTDISVDWNKPDIFIWHQPGCPDNADAAAGNITKCATCHPAPRSHILEVGVGSSLTTPDTTGSYNSQQLALLPQCGPCATVQRNQFATDGQCETLKDFNSQNLAQQGASHVHAHASPRAFDAISVDVPRVFNSQDLANLPQCGPCATVQMHIAEGPCQTLKGFNSQDLACTSEIAGKEAPGSSDPGSQAMSALKDFNSQDLACSSELTGNEAPGSSSPGSQASPAFHLNVKSKTSASIGCDDNLEASPRAYDAISQDQQPDFNSQDLAVQSQSVSCATMHSSMPLADGQSATLQGALDDLVHASPRAFDAISEDVQLELTSHDLAVQPQCRPFVTVQSDSPLADGRCKTLKEFKEFNSQHLACTSEYASEQAMSSTGTGSQTSSALLDFNSQDLACTTKVVADGPGETLKAFNSQDLAGTSNVAGNEAPGSSSPGSQASPVLEGFNSQDHACTSEFAGNEAPGSSNPGSQASPVFDLNDKSKTSDGVGCDDNLEKQSQCGRIATVPQCGPCATVHNNEHAGHTGFADEDQRITLEPLELPLGFKDTIDSIVRIYAMRKKPSRRQLQDAVLAILGAAKIHAVTHNRCRHYVHAQSQTLSCALDAHTLHLHI